MQTNHHLLCQGCLYDAKTLCLSKTKKKDLKYQKQIEANEIVFRLTYCGERKIAKTGAS